MHLLVGNLAGHREALEVVIQELKRGSLLGHGVPCCQHQMINAVKKIIMSRRVQTPQTFLSLTCQVIDDLLALAFDSRVRFVLSPPGCAYPGMEPDRK